MAAPDPDHLYTMACQLLGVAAQCLADADRPPLDQQYVTACDPDLVCCSTLAVRQTTIVPIEGDPPGKCVFRRQIHYDLWVTRCVPLFTRDGNLPPIGSCADDPPAPGSLTGGAQAVLADRWAIVQCLLPALRALGNASPWCCAPLSFVAIEPVCESNCAGTRFEVTITI